MEKLPPFRNEPITDFSNSTNRRAMEQALATVRGQLGREYDLLIGGERVKTGDMLRSVNPSQSERSGGRASQGHGRTGAPRGRSGLRILSASGPRRPQRSASQACCGRRDIIRERKLEFDAWLVLEAGKTWPEAEADVSEAIDFCEYYAREMQRLSGPQRPMVQLPGEHDEMRYLPLGVGVVIPPWNFPLAIWRA